MTITCRATFHSNLRAQYDSQNPAISTVLFSLVDADTVGAHYYHGLSDRGFDVNLSSPERQEFALLVYPTPRFCPLYTKVA